MKTEIEFYVKSVYGKECCYVADKKLAEIIKLITGRVQLMSYDFEGFTQLGFTFKEVIAPRK